MLPLGCREPVDVTTIGLLCRWIEDAELDGVDFGRSVRRGAGRLEFGDGNFNIDGADLVGTGVVREGGHRIYL